MHISWHTVKLYVSKILKNVLSHFGHTLRHPKSVPPVTLSLLSFRSLLLVCSVNVVKWPVIQAPVSWDPFADMKKPPSSPLLSQRPCLTLIKQILRTSPFIIATWLMHQCLWVCVYKHVCCPKRPTVGSERGWCRKINTGMTAEPCQGGSVTHYPSDQSSSVQTHKSKCTHKYTQTAGAVRNFCKLFSISTHHFVSCTFYCSFPLRFFILKSGLMKYITIAWLSLRENA